VHPSDFISPAKVQRGDLGKLPDHIEAQPRNSLPDRGVAAGTDVRVDAHDAQAVLLDDGPCLAAILMPDAEARRRPAHVRLHGPPGAQPRVDAKPKLPAWELVAKTPELVERAGVEADAGLEEPPEIGGKFLGAQGNIPGWNAGPHRPLALITGAGVDMQPAASHDADERRVRAGLHRITDGEAEGIGEPQRLARPGLQRALVIDVHRRAELAPDSLGLLGGEEFKCLHAGREG